MTSVRFDVVDQADELVSPDPGDGVCLAHTAFQPATDRDQELISHLVTQAIVDVFEAVDVEEKHPEPRIRPSLRPCDGLAQTVQKECAVGKTGQGVVERVVLEAVLGRLSLGDVGLGTRHSDDLPLVVPHGQSPREDPAVSPVVVEHAVLGLEVGRLTREMIRDLGLELDRHPAGSRG